MYSEAKCRAMVIVVIKWDMSKTTTITKSNLLVTSYHYTNYSTKNTRTWSTTDSIISIATISLTQPFYHGSNNLVVIDIKSYCLDALLSEIAFINVYNYFIFVIFFGSYVDPLCNTSMLYICIKLSKKYIINCYKAVDYLAFMMAVEGEVHGTYEVYFSKKTIVKAIGPLPESHVLTLSNLDLLSGRFPVTYFYFYRNPLVANFTSIIEALKFSLAKTLNHFYPFSGRIVENPSTSEPEIICNNSGALVVEACANIALKELNFYNLNQSLQGKLVSINHDIPLQIQVTRYTCGGLAITFTFDHALGDASAFSKFLITWSEIARDKKISCIPDHRRSLRARFPPTYDPWVDQAFISCTMEDILKIPMKNILLKRLYHIDISSINQLQRLASIDGSKRTKIEAFSAYVWKVMVRAIDESHKHCKMGWLVDGRTRMSKDQNSMSNYIGNVLSLGFGEASMVELKNGSLSDVAKIVHEAISKVTNETHFLDLIDWIECHRPGLMLSKIVLGRAGPALVVSSGRRFPVVELDFGFGSPVLGTVCSTIERIGVGYMNQRPSARGDGSWTVSAILWPELVAALESDSEHVFQPMTSNHLQL